MESIIKLANVTDGKTPDATRSVDDPGVKLLAAVITDDEAEVALMCTRTPMNVKQIAENGGVSLQEITPVLERLAQIGIIFVADQNNEPYYNRVPWAPGIMEHLLLNESTRNLEVATLFDEFGFMGGKNAARVPVGMGALRVIPVAKAIEAEPRRVSYEEIMTYLNQSDLYSAADCVCRTAKKLKGEACEHTIEGMCIQIGPEADYYIRTGRAKKITKEEAIAIIEKAEREGLVHEIFNNEGPNKSSFICNCCGCSCSVLRRATLFKTPDYAKSNYVAKVDKDKCVACGACVENCQANALSLGESLCKLKESKQAVEKETPYDTEWGEDKWNHDFRVRKMVGAEGTSPCKSECPAHVSIQGYIKKASQGKYDEALKIIKKDNPFPAVCGRICPHTCESECTRNNIDEPLAIDDIKKFIADKDLNAKERYKPAIYENSSEKVAIIGSGPAGLSCAYYLASEGYKVTVFEKQKVLGGMLTLGIPSFRLEKDVISAEIDVIRELGVEFKTGVEVGKDVTIPQLRKQGYKAFYIAIGAQAGRELGLAGEDAEGVATGVDFLNKVSLNDDVKLSGNTIVIGGGNVAIDVARTAIRVGEDSVFMYCLENSEEMPALKEEQEEAKGEGIEINNCWGPKRIIVDNGKVTGVEFKKCVSVFDEDGRFNPRYDENETKTVKADNVLISVGQSMEWGNLLEESNVELNRNKTVKVHEISFQTDDFDVFAGGDVVTGPKFAINAIAGGKQGATSIHRFLQGRGLTVHREREYHPLDKGNLNLESYDCIPRQKTHPVDTNASRYTFKDLRVNLTEEQIKKETQRCLGCGVTVVDEYQCLGCGICTTKCEFDAIHLQKVNDVASVEPEEMTFIIEKYAQERQARIEVKKKKQQQA